MLMGMLIALFAIPSKAGTSEQKSSSENTEVAESDLWAENLKNTMAAYNSEIDANVRYTAYSEKAKTKGHYEIALLFKAVSKSTSIQAKNHRDVLSIAKIPISKIEPKFTIKTTKENLKEAIAHETHQIDKMYPGYIICANKANHEPSNKNMSSAYQISMKHKAFFEKALDALENNNVDLLSEVYFVCPSCGNTYENNVHQFCQFCDTPYWKYSKITD